jgi:hypothetical protein
MAVIIKGQNIKYIVNICTTSIFSYKDGKISTRSLALMLYHQVLRTWTLQILAFYIYILEINSWIILGSTVGRGLLTISVAK